MTISKTVAALRLTTSKPSAFDVVLKMAVTTVATAVKSLPLSIRTVHNLSVSVGHCSMYYINILPNNYGPVIPPYTWKSTAKIVPFPKFSQMFCAY
jgi:hypothetical protein